MTAVAKAYRVEPVDDDEGRAVVVHAPRRSLAKKLGAAELDAEYMAVRAERAPAFDGITDSDELMRQQIRMGWWFTCFHCEKKIEDEEEENEERGETFADHFVIRHGDIWCSTACALAWLREKRQKRIELWSAIERAVAKFPGASLEHAFKNMGGAWVIQVQFPGESTSVFHEV